MTISVDELLTQETGPKFETLAEFLNHYNIQVPGINPHLGFNINGQPYSVTFNGDHFQIQEYNPKNRTFYSVITPHTSKDENGNTIQLSGRIDLINPKDYDEAHRMLFSALMNYSKNGSLWLEILSKVDQKRKEGQVPSTQAA